MTAKPRKNVHPDIIAQYAKRIQDSSNLDPHESQNLAEALIANRVISTIVPQYRRIDDNEPLKIGDLVANRFRDNGTGNGSVIKITHILKRGSGVYTDYQGYSLTRTHLAYWMWRPKNYKKVELL